MRTASLLCATAVFGLCIKASAQDLRLCDQAMEGTDMAVLCVEIDALIDDLEAAWAEQDTLIAEVRSLRDEVRDLRARNARAVGFYDEGLSHFFLPKSEAQQAWCSKNGLPKGAIVLPETEHAELFAKLYAKSTAIATSERIINRLRNDLASCEATISQRERRTAPLTAAEVAADFIAIRVTTQPCQRGTRVEVRNNHATRSINYVLSYTATNERTNETRHQSDRSTLRPGEPHRRVCTEYREVGGRDTWRRGPVTLHSADWH